jgi:hypothetical protein
MRIVGSSACDLSSVTLVVLAELLDWRGAGWCEVLEEGLVLQDLGRRDGDGLVPGAAGKFYFTVWTTVAGELNKVMGKRVSLHYDEKVGLPTSCFGETRHYVTRVTAVEEIPLAPGIVVPTPSTAPPAVAPK